MISRLRGQLAGRTPDGFVLDVNGVGYVVHCSARTLQALPAEGEPVALAIETHVREDQIRLFGFLSDVEREWFRLLQTVQGVGARFDSHYDRKWFATEPPATRLVFIGDELDEAALRAGLQGAIA